MNINIPKYDREGIFDKDLDVIQERENWIRWVTGDIFIQGSYVEKSDVHKNLTIGVYKSEYRIWF